jgi:hypothetical protein
MTPAARSTRLLKAEGYQVASVERFVAYPRPGHRVDLFGFIDLLAIRPGETLAVQACAATDHARRAEKVRTSQTLPACLAANWRVEVHSWRLFRRSRRWEVRREGILAPAKVGL